MCNECSSFLMFPTTASAMYEAYENRCNVLCNSDVCFNSLEFIDSPN